MIQQFGDRYFPGAKRTLSELPTAQEHAKLLSGDYIESRGSFSNFLWAAGFLSQTKITVDADGRPLVPDLFGGEPRRWIEVSPFQWQDAHGTERLAASVSNGRVQRWSIDSVSPLNAAWLLPAFVFSLLIVGIVALSWPIGAINRRRYRVALGAAAVNVRLYRAVRVLCWWVLAAIGGWALLFDLLISNAAADAITALDWFIGSLELLGALGFCLLLAVALRSLWVSRKHSKLNFVGNSFLVFAAVILLWVAVGFHLINYGARY